MAYARDHPFMAIRRREFRSVEQYTPPVAHHSRLWKANYGGRAWIIKDMATTGERFTDWELVLAMNEIMAAMIYNRVFCLYAPILVLVGDKDNHYAVASEYNARLRHGADGDKADGFLVDCIMANWDVYTAGNIFSIDKNSGNTAWPPTRILRLDVGGCMSFRSMGADKPEFLDNAVPMEHKTLLAHNPHMRKMIDMPAEMKYIKAMYRRKHGGFAELDAIGRDILASGRYVTPAVRMMVNHNICQIKRRWWYYLRDCAPIILHNIWGGDELQHWTPGSPAYKYQSIPKAHNVCRIMTWNIGAITSGYIADKYFYKTDICCFQEVSAATSALCTIKCNPHRPRGAYYITNGIYYDGGIKVIHVDEFALEVGGIKLAHTGKCVSVLGIKHYSTPLLIMNVHLDVSGGDQGIAWRRASIDKIMRYYARYRAQYANCIIMGDFNVYNRADYAPDQMKILKKLKGKYGADIWKEMGMGNSSYYSDKSIGTIDMMKRAGFREAFNMMGIQGPYNTTRYSGRVDYIWLSPDWNIPLRGLYCGYNTESDHLPLIIDI